MSRLFTLLTMFLVVAGSLGQAPVEPPDIRSVSFSPDGTLLAASAMPKDRGGIVRVWDTATHKLVSKYDKAGESPMVEFASDGKSLVLANGRTNLVVLDPKIGEKSGEIGPFPGEIVNVVPAGKSRWVALGKNNVFHVWDIEANNVVASLGGGGQRYWGWAVSPGGKWLFASRNSKDQLWNLEKGEEVLGVIKSAPNRVNEATFVGEDRLVLSSNFGTQRLIELPTGKELLRSKNEGGTSGMRYSPAGGMLAGRGYSSTSVWLTPLTFRAANDEEAKRTAALLRECDSDDYATREKAAIALVELGFPIEPLLHKAMADGPSAEVRMRARVARETILNKPKFQLDGHRDEVRVMAFAPDGKLIATGGADGLVILWNPATGKEVARLSASE